MRSQHPAFGIVFIVTILVLAVKFPQPTPMMYTAFRVVLALAAAGVAAMIPGFIYVNISEWLRTGGAMAVFCGCLLQQSSGPDFAGTKRARSNSALLDSFGLQVQWCSGP